MNLESLETRQPSSSSKKLYTGFATLEIVAVNPTREEIAKLYDVVVEKTKEPNYFLDNSTLIDIVTTHHIQHHCWVSFVYLSQRTTVLVKEVRINTLMHIVVYVGQIALAICLHVTKDWQTSTS